METRAGDPAAFARFDLYRVPSPAFVVDEAAVRRNLSVLRDIGDRAGIKVLGALKAFSMWSLGGVISEYLDGVCASGIYEARLGREEYKGEVATYCAAYKPDDLAEILRISDHAIFNSPGQIARMKPVIDAARKDGVNFDIGLRLNPLHAEGEVPKYDPSQPHSRLGFPVDQLRAEHLEGVDGLHIHNLCEQDFLPLQRTWGAIESRVMPHVADLKWLNFGGGHHVTRADYQIDDLIAFLQRIKAQTGLGLYIEPGEAMALDAGILVGEILDVIHNGMPVAITDISATCHMPDVIEAPYRPAMLGEATDHETPEVRIGGPSCLAGDVIGDYRIAGGAEVSKRFAFLDQAHYSMVKTNTFNGVQLPSIYMWDSETDQIELVKEFGYSTFRDRLS